MICSEYLINIVFIVFWWFTLFVFITFVFIFTEESASHEAVLARQEEEFVVHSQERIMGLLGAIIPPENKVRYFTSKKYYEFQKYTKFSVLMCISHNYHTNRIKAAQPTSGGAVTAVTNCRANCVEISHSNRDPIYRFWDKPEMWTRWMVGAAPHKRE